MTCDEKTEKERSMTGRWFVYVARGGAAWVEGPFETQEQAQDHQTRVLAVPEVYCRILALHTPEPPSRTELLEKVYEAVRRALVAENPGAWQKLMDALNAVEKA